MRVFLQEGWGAAPSLHPAGCPPLIGGCLPRPAGAPGALQQAAASVGCSVPTPREEDLRWHALPQWHTRLLGRSPGDHLDTIMWAPIVDYATVALQLYRASGPPAGPGTAEPLHRADDVDNAKFAQVPGPELCATALGGRAFPGASLNPSSADSSGGFRHAFLSEAL